MADRVVVMADGKIEQVGTPIEIYCDPESRFVANFVGTMNFLPAVVLGPRQISLGGVELDCADGLDEFDSGAAVTVCIRPEDLAVRKAGSDAPNAVVARVGDLEFLGAFYRATFVVEQMGDQQLIADFAPNLVRELDIRAGADLSVVFPENRMRVFASH